MSAHDTALPWRNIALHALQSLTVAHEIIEEQQRQIGMLLALADANEAADSGDPDRIRGAVARLEEWS